MREKPLRAWLQDRQTLIPRPKLITGLSKRTVPPIELPAGVTREEAVSAIAGTNWARGIATGIADKGGLSGQARDNFIERFAYQVADGIVSSSYLPAIERLAERRPGRPRPTTAGPTPVRVGKEITREELEETKRKRR